MTNLQALGFLCTGIVCTFYPDEAALRLVLFCEQLDADADASPKNPAIFRCAVKLVMGYVETSHTENGVTMAVDRDAVKKSLLYWCDYYGLDADEELGDYARTIENGSNLW